MTDDLRDMLAEALRQASTSRVLTGRLGKLNDPWWERWGEEVIAALPPEFAQDYRDGRALRLLREALPPDCYIQALWVPGPNGWWWEVCADPDTSFPLPDPLARKAFTIAEAADKAREALK